MSQRIIARISAAVITTLSLECNPGEPIYLGDSNIDHMKDRHPVDYERYHAYIGRILSSPDYVAINEKNNSLEYVKEFKIDGAFVKVAVRVSQSGRYFARSMYALNANRVQNFISKGTLKRIDSHG